MSRRAFRVVAGVLATIAVVNLGVGAAVVGHHFARPGDRHPALERTAHFRVVPEQPTADAVREHAVTALLATRASAIRHHDRAAFAATLDPRSPQFRAQQLRYFANLQRVPFASWSYSLDTANTAPTGGSQFLRYQATVWLPHVVLHYAIKGFDRSPTSADMYYTFVQRGSRWYTGSDSDDADLAYETTRDIWDFGPVIVTRGRHSLVLGHPGGPVSMRELAAETDRDIPRVVRVWGRSWSQRIVVLVPSTTGELGKLLPDVGDLSQIAAVASAELVEANHQTTPVGDRVLVNPHNYLRLNGKGRQVVISHEITHVASRVATGPAVPNWLIEGLADYVGYREVQVAAPTAAVELRSYLNSGHRLGTLPSDSDYNGSNRHLDRTYDESWLACRFIAEHWGQATLVRLYSVVGAEHSGSTTAATDRGLRAVLHESLATFTRQWQSYVVAVLR